jgi:hypothetical protein
MRVHSNGNALVVQIQCVNQYLASFKDGDIIAHPKKGWDAVLNRKKRNTPSVPSKITVDIAEIEINMMTGSA